MLAAISRLIRPGAGKAKARNSLLPHVVETVGGGIAEAKDFEKLLTPALEAATEYFARQIDVIPGPLNVSEQAFAQDPRLSALFPEAAEILRAMGRSLEVKESLPGLARNGHQHVHALLGVRQRKIDGEIEIFADHTLRSLAPQEADTRAYLGFVAVKRLLNDYAEHTTKLRRRERLLKVEWNIRNEIAEVPAPDNRSEYVNAAEELAPDNLLAGLIAWLESPAKYFRLEAGGVFLPGHGQHGAAAKDTELPLLHCSDRRQWLVSIVRIPVVEGLQALEQESHTHRHIFI